MDSWMQAVLGNTQDMMSCCRARSQLCSYQRVRAPTNSSSRAAAIQPGAWRGLVLVTLFSSSRAFLMSEISASDEILIDFMSVRYPCRARQR